MRYALALGALGLLALAGCASTVPREIRDAPAGNPQLAEVRTNVTQFTGARVRWGGTIANQLAISDPLVNATIVFYGHNPDLAQVGRIKGPLLAHYAGLDGNILQGVPA